MCPSSSEPLEVFTCEALGAGFDLCGSAGGDDAAALFAAARPHVDDPVGALDDVEVVLDDDDGCPV